MSRYRLEDWNGNIIDDETGEWLGQERVVDRLNHQQKTIDFLNGNITMLLRSYEEEQSKFKGLDVGVVEEYYVDTMSGRDIVRECSDDTYLTSGEIVGLLNGMSERIRVLEKELSDLKG